MIKPPKIYLLTCYCLLLIGLFSCGSLQVQVANVQEIQQNRTAYNRVKIQGKVINIAPFLGTGAYEIQDSTSSIWVISNSLPNLGDELIIQGKVQYKSIPIAGNEEGEVYIEEQEKLQPNSGNK